MLRSEAKARPAGKKTPDELAAAWLPVIQERIVDGFHPVRIILFGSFARGEARVDSDFDLLVVLPEVEDKHQAVVSMLNALGDLPVPTDVLVTTLEEIERRGHILGSVLRPALREGKVIYERG